MKLKITNETKYDGRVLRSLILAGLKAHGDERTWSVTVISTKRRRRGDYGVHGRAWVGSGALTMRLPTDSFSTKNFARVLIHEVDHCLGLRHGEMAKWWEIEVPWVEGFPEVITPPALKPKAAPAKTVQEKRAERAAKRLEDHERKLAREKRLVSKWRKKVRYYEKALAEKAANPRPPKPRVHKKPDGLWLRMRGYPAEEFGIVVIDTAHSSDDDRKPMAEWFDALPRAKSKGSNVSVRLPVEEGTIAFLECLAGELRAWADDDIGQMEGRDRGPSFRRNAAAIEKAVDEFQKKGKEAEDGN